MAQFDLKKAKVYLIDGTNKGLTMAVNNAAGYTTGTTTMAVDLFTGTVTTGQTFKMAGDDQIYSITAHSETLGNTTSITFTPGLQIAATDDEVITLDGITLLIKVGEGNVTYDEKQTIEYKKDRGLLDTVREGDEDPIDVRLDVQWQFLRTYTGEIITPEDALKNEGGASAWVSSATDKCEPYAVDVLIIYKPVCPGVKAEIIRLPDYRWESLNHDAKAGTLSTSGKCNVKRATLSRSTQA